MLKTGSCSGSCEQVMLMVMVVRDHSLTTIYKDETLGVVKSGIKKMVIGDVDDNVQIFCS